jgi:hypothetical protein
MTSLQKHVITTWLLDVLDADKTYNGFADNRQEIVWLVNGQEIVRSNGGVLTEQPAFVDLACAKLREIYRGQHDSN